MFTLFTITLKFELLVFYLSIIFENKILYGGEYHNSDINNDDRQNRSQKKRKDVLDF